MRFLCKIGIHNYETVKEVFGTATEKILLKFTSEIAIRSVIEKCKYCSKRKAYIVSEDGTTYERDPRILEKSMEK